MFSDQNVAEFDPYWHVIAGVNGFNKNCKMTVAASQIKVCDESMSPFQPANTKSGNLPNIYFVLRKPEPLGIELKTVCEAMMGIMIHVEIQCGKWKDKMTCVIGLTMWMNRS